MLEVIIFRITCQQTPYELWKSDNEMMQRIGDIEPCLAGHNPSSIKAIRSPFNPTGSLIFSPIDLCHVLATNDPNRHFRSQS